MLPESHRLAEKTQILHGLRFHSSVQSKEVQEVPFGLTEFRA